MHTTVSSNKNQRPIHFGIMCNGTCFPAWEADCLQKLLAAENVEPALLIIDGDSSTTSNSWKKLGKLRNFKKLFWYIYSFFFVERRSRAMRPVDMAPALADVPCIHCRIIRKGKFSQYFSKADVSEIRGYDLDFILRFGFNIIRGEILQAAHFGVWSFHHDDEKAYRGDPPGFWEICKGDHATGAILQRLTDRLDGGIVLKRGFFRTNDTSYVRNRDMIYFESTDWPAQVCIDIQNGNAGYFNAPPSRTSAPIYYAPTNVQMISFLLRIVRNSLRRLYDLLFTYEQWNVGIVDDPIHVFLTPGARPQVRWLPAPPRSRFIADPFAIRRGKDLYILLEDYDYRTSTGCISAISIYKQSLSPLEKAIDVPFHMAYPYLLEHIDQIYCIPETAEAREVRLYKAKEFPNSWVKEATLIKDFAGVDSTVFQYEGQWWLLATDENDGPNHKLKAWHAPDLLGPWQPHVANPVKIDIRSARPAGTPFMHDGHLYRPSQDCSEIYGGKIVLNRVVQLTPTEFKEEQVAVIEPYKNSPYPDGLHTISAVGNMTTIDGMKTLSIAKSLSVMIDKMKRIRFRLSALLRRK
jgi:hypothetical protein